jgi:hypothetical protein
MYLLFRAQRFIADCHFICFDCFVESAPSFFALKGGRGQMPFATCLTGLAFMLLLFHRQQKVGKEDFMAKPEKSCKDR